MNTGIRGSADFSCSQCGKRYSLHGGNLEFYAESGSERGMGDETQYVSDFGMQCSNCGNPISIKFEVWEYPVGVVNYISHSETGASDVDCEFDITYYPDSDDESSTRVVGAAAGGAILGASLGGPFGALIGGAIGALLGDSVNKSKKGSQGNG